MKKLAELYSKYYELQEESHFIQQDKKHWPEGAGYEWMVARVNELTPLIRTLALEIKLIEKRIK